LSGNAEHFPKPDIETLSDLIFGLALSIGAITLLGTAPSSLAEIESDLVGFAFSFGILISVWMRYTDIMSVLPLETRATIFLNIVMLFLVSIEPYLFYLVSLFGHIADSEFVNFASVFYALDMSGLMAILAFFTQELTIEEKKLIPPKLMSKYKRLRNFLFLWAGLYLLTAIPQFWTWRIQNTPLRFYLWLVPLSAYWIGSAYESPLRPRTPGGTVITVSCRLFP
jgi:uncharacterized membrane protein